MQNTKQTYLALGLLAAALAPNLASAATLLNFAVGTGKVIPTGPYSSVTYDSVLIQGGTAVPATHNAASGTLSTAIGGTYDGTFFDSAVNGDPSAATRIGFENGGTSQQGGTGRYEVANGIFDNYANYLGICVSFSAPVELNSFGFLDLDGTTAFASQEWTSSFAYNSNTMATIAPTVTLGDATRLSQVAATGLNWNTNLTGAPTNADINVTSYTGGGGTDFNADPDDADSQVSYNYNSQLVTELYFLWGVRDRINPNGFNSQFQGNEGNSGITGFTVVPEPSSTALIGLGVLGLLMRRKK